ncbi:hypothetical protein [Ideonella sp. A 288]|uniref:hypothetical protein n=1 Tax=Ideonella sp. A 288 TaxID=1962181 RepID=UPI001185454B|nr:hypothetical protein [Ideonella sp. A 288]
MNVTQLLDEVRRRVPQGAPFGTRWKGRSVVTTPGGEHHIAAAARIDVQGRRREQFWCDDVRVEHAVWLRLTCTEGECPHATQVRAQWAAFRRRNGAAARSAPTPPRPLMAEVAVHLGPQRFIARPACFPCYTPCPNGAHPPMTLDKTGFDLFDDGSCLGGGVTQSGGVQRPRLPTVRAAEAYLLARHLETLAAVGAARDASRGRPGGPAAEAD